MDYPDALAVQDAYLASGARCMIYQQHPRSGPYSAASPWVVRSYDRRGNMVESTDRLGALNWLIRAWIGRNPDREEPEHS